jgi:hypothetical protein
MVATPLGFAPTRAEKASNPTGLGFVRVLAPLGWGEMSGSFGFAAASDLGFVRVVVPLGFVRFPLRPSPRPPQRSMRDWEFYQPR